MPSALGSVVLLALAAGAAGLVVCGIDVPRARPSSAAFALEGYTWPAAFPLSAKDLTPEDAGLELWAAG